MRIDPHIHSIYSGHAGLHVEEIVRYCKANNIVPALTDHDSVQGWHLFEALAKANKMDFIKGEEIHVFEGGKCVGELLGLFLQEQVLPGQVGVVLDKLRDQNALIVAAHPFDKLRKALFVRSENTKEMLKKIDAIEVFNSRTFLPWYNGIAEDFAKEKHFPFTAGSDSHFSIELGNAFLEVDAGSLEEARKKILKRKCSFYGKSSPRRVQIYTQLAKLGFFK